MQVATKGYPQIHGVDFTKTFAPVAKDCTVCMTFGIVLYMDSDRWVCELIDIKAAFLHGMLKTVCYIDWPESIVTLGFATAKDMVEYCIELQNSMYGNVDAALAWQTTIKEHLTKVMRLTQSKADLYMYFRKSETGKLNLMIVIYVDDTLVCSRQVDVDWFKTTLKETLGLQSLESNRNISEFGMTGNAIVRGTLI